MKKGVLDFIKDYRVILLIILIIGSVGTISTKGIQQGLDLKGGSLIQIHLEKPVDQDTMNKVTSILDKRLNIFGVKDIKVRSSGTQDVIIEIAGVKPEEVVNVIGKPGKFEAKIANQTALTGADIVKVEAYQIKGVEWSVPFKVSLDGANRFAQIAEGKAGYPVDMYLDDKLISSPEIAPELATGRPATDVQITGYAESKEAAEKEAKEIQTVLQSGALPVKIKIEGISSVSPALGAEFKQGALIAGFLAILAVALMILVRYRIPLLVVPILFTCLCEVLLILGVASIIKWNIDLPAIAGIIAAVGTGVDDQIIITDEVLKEETETRKRKMSMKTQIKRAFFIVFSSAATLIAAMFPLAYIGFSRGYTGIGMLVGFAFTTIIGVLIGVFITRPVYAKFIERIL